MQTKGKTGENPLKFKKVLYVSEEVWKELMRRKIESGYRTVDEVLRDLLSLPPPTRAVPRAETGSAERFRLAPSLPPSRKVTAESEHQKGMGALPYVAEVYINNQVLIPAELVRTLGLQNARIACIMLEYKSVDITFNAELLKTRHTDSRQFTIPKSIRDKYGITPGAKVKVKKIEAIR